MGALKACPRVFGDALEALWTRLDAAGASRRGPGSPKWIQIRYKILLKRVSVTVSGPDLVFIHFLIVFGVRRYSKVFKLHRKNAVILNSRVVHSQDATMQTVYRTTCRNTSKIEQNLIRNGAQTVPDATWKHLEGSGGQNGSSGRARRPDPRYIRRL